MKEIIQKTFVSLHTSELTNDLNAEDLREYTRKYGTCAEIGNMNVIVFTVSLIFRNERFNNVHKTSRSGNLHFNHASAISLLRDSRLIWAPSL